jgi:bifunctional pyridoxal-dependent enzyme with beta-cystathionase and maltose regulon repressor activities
MKVCHPPRRLSDRVRELQPSATLAVTARVKRLKDQGVDVIGFGAGEPDFDTPAALKQAAIDALNAGHTHYTPTAGEPGARKAIAEKLRSENGIACTADDIVITVGAKHAMYLVLHCLLDPERGQTVVIPTPAWVSYRPMVELAGGDVVEVPGATDRDFKITEQQLEEAITDHTAAVIINSPSNPCGTMYAPQELRALAAVLEGHPQITIITDEIYEKLIYGEFEHFSLGSLESLADRVVTINGLSKAYADEQHHFVLLCGDRRGDQERRRRGRAHAQHVRRAIAAHARTACRDARRALPAADGGVLRLPRHRRLLRQANQGRADDRLGPVIRRSPAGGSQGRRRAGRGLRRVRPRPRAPELRVLDRRDRGRLPADG